MRKLIRKYVFFLIAGIVFISGIAIQGINLILNNPISDRVVLLSETVNTIYLEEGKYNLFYEYDTNRIELGILKVTKIIDITLNLLNIQINGIDSQTEVAVREDQSATFTIRNIQGKSLFSFRIHESGVYNIALDYGQDDLASDIKFSVVAGFSEMLFSGIKRIGIYIVVTIFFLLIGWYMYLRGKRRDHARQPLDQQIK